MNIASARHRDRLGCCACSHQKTGTKCRHEASGPVLHHLRAGGAQNRAPAQYTRFSGPRTKGTSKMGEFALNRPPHTGIQTEGRQEALPVSGLAGATKYGRKSAISSVKQ
jgi:hypothetical protein